MTIDLVRFELKTPGFAADWVSLYNGSPALVYVKNADNDMFVKIPLVTWGNGMSSSYVEPGSTSIPVLAIRFVSGANTDTINGVIATFAGI